MPLRRLLLRAEDQKPLTLTLSRRERGLTELLLRYADVKYRVELRSASAEDQKPLTLTLSRRERGLTELLVRDTPT
ncbi:hypothetical protein BSZ28_21010 [Pseudomonas moraviensis]|jgi:hypothetical protein|nr:hypothetical protein BSZ28_21010 [Pseudomonas moraviensis]